MVSQRLQNLPTAFASLGVFAIFVAVTTSQPLFELSTEAVVNAKLTCTLHIATLTAKDQKVTKRHGSSCYDMLMYEFDNYSFFYVGEDMETLVGLAFTMVWLTLALLATSTLCLFLRVRYLSLPKTVANFFAGVAAFTSIVALILMSEATGESKVARRYDYSQTPSIKVTGWLPIFPFLQLVVGQHFDQIIQPKTILKKFEDWKDGFKRKLSKTDKEDYETYNYADTKMAGRF